MSHTLTASILITDLTLKAILKYLLSTSLPVNPCRGPPQTRHQAAVSQSARFKINRPVTTQAVGQLLDVLDEVTQLQCEESIEEANLMEEVHEIVKEFQSPTND